MRLILLLVILTFSACSSRPDRPVPTSDATTDSLSRDAASDSEIPPAGLPDTAGWRRFTSARWHLSFAYPPEAEVRVRGPLVPGCGADTASTTEGAASAAREIYLSYSAETLDSIAVAHGFYKTDSGWMMQGSVDQEPAPMQRRGDLVVLSGSRLQRTYTDGESAEEQATLTLAVLRHADGCATILQFEEIESRGAELRASDTFLTAVMN